MLSDSLDSAVYDREERLPILGRPQMADNLNVSVVMERNYLLSLQSFRFCLSSLPLIKQLSAGMIEQKTTMSSHTGNEASSSSHQSIIIGH